MRKLTKKLFALYVGGEYEGLMGLPKLCEISEIYAERKLSHKQKRDLREGKGATISANIFAR